MISTVSPSVSKEIAESMGLWLAEGDNKTIAEITFTNSQPELIKLFDNTLRQLFKNYNLNIRLYVYSSDRIKIQLPIDNCVVKYYIHKRATRPYYIWRLASRKLTKKWKNLVKNIEKNKEIYPDLLRGFFAGEGNIKTGSHYNRTIRISQGKPLKLVEDILNHLKIEFNYSPKERSYIITHKPNWDKCAKIKIADLHPIKKEKFWKAYNGFREAHYKHNHIKNKLIKLLIGPYTTYELALKFNRSPARIYDILDIFKKESKIINFRIRSKDYWIRKDQNIIIISDIKQKYLNLLKKFPKRTYEIAKYFKVDDKSSFRRLKELEKLGLVKRNKDKVWSIIKTDKKVLIYGTNLRDR